MPTRSLVLTLALALAGAAWAGPRVRLALTDGSQVEGELESYGQGAYRVILGSQTVVVPEADVAHVAFLATEPTPGATPQPTPSATPQPTPSATPQPTPSAMPQPTPQPTPSATPQPTPSATATPSATPRPAPSLAPTPTPEPSATPASPLARAFGYVPRVGDLHLVKRWEQTKLHRGDRFDEQVLEARYVDRIDALDGGEVLVRTRRYEAFAGGEELPDLTGVTVQITRRGPRLYSFARLDGEPVSEALKGLLITEFEQERGLSRHEFLPEGAVAPGESWELALAETHLYQQFVALGLEVRDTESVARGVLLEPRDGLLGVGLTFKVKPIALNGIPLDASTSMAAGTTLWVPADGSGPIRRVEESGRFRGAIQGQPLRMEITKVVEVEVQRGH